MLSVSMSPDRAATARSVRWSRTVTIGVASGVLGLGVLAFAACAALVTTGWTPLDRADGSVGRTLLGLTSGHPGWTDAFLVIGAIFWPWTFRAAGLVVAAVLFRRGQRRLGLWLASTVVAGTLLLWGLKALFARPRPALVGAQVADGYAFPSGHALTSALVAGALLLVLLRYDPGRRIAGLGWACAVLLIGVVGLDRLALGVHHLSDVVAGWCVALAVLGAGMLAYTHPNSAPSARTTERSHRVAVILNPAKVEDRAGFRRRLERRALAAGWPAPTWYETSRDDPGRTAARAALEGGVDLIVVAGGDGTVRAVSGELAGRGTPLGIVPAGTGNLLARNLGLPLDHGAAIRVALEGYDRRIDLVRVSGDGIETERFAVMAGLGLDAAIVGEAPPLLKTQMGWPAYLVSAARNFSFPAVSVEVTVGDAEPVRRRARTVLIGNVGTLAGGLPLLPEARPDDGLLDVLVLAPRALTDWPRLAWRVLRRSRGTDERLSHWRGRHVAVRADDACPRQLDGDVISPGRELRAGVEHEALTVRVPRTVGQAPFPAPGDATGAWSAPQRTRPK